MRASNIAKSSAEYNCEYCVKEEILNEFFCVVVVFGFYAAEQKPVCNEKGDEVHQAVIAYLQEAYLDEIGADMLRDVLEEIHIL